MSFLHLPDSSDPQYVVQFIVGELPSEPRLTYTGGDYRPFVAVVTATSPEGIRVVALSIVFVSADVTDCHVLHLPMGLREMVSSGTGTPRGTPLPVRLEVDQVNHLSRRGK